MRPPLPPSHGRTGGVPVCTNARAHYLDSALRGGAGASGQRSRGVHKSFAKCLIYHLTNTNFALKIPLFVHIHTKGKIYIVSNRIEV